MPGGILGLIPEIDCGYGRLGIIDEAQIGRCRVVWDGIRRMLDNRDTCVHRYIPAMAVVWGV